MAGSTAAPADPPACCREPANTRTDEYGGSLDNRLRFLREIVAAVAKAVGAERIGVRFTPLFESTDQERVYIGVVEADPHGTYSKGG